MDEEGNRQRKPCRVEIANPGTDWEEAWRLARLPGLGSENIFFLFKMMHDILPTQERVARTNPRASPACPMPQCGAEVESRVHDCRWNDGVGERVKAVVADYFPNLPPEQILCLNFQLDEGQAGVELGLTRG